MKAAINRLLIMPRAAEADSVINSAQYSLVPDFAKVFHEQ